jgi:hypothetical protein
MATVQILSSDKIWWNYLAHIHFLTITNSATYNNFWAFWGSSKSNTTELYRHRLVCALHHVLITIILYKSSKMIIIYCNSSTMSSKMSILALAVVAVVASRPLLSVENFIDLVGVRLGKKSNGPRDAVGCLLPFTGTALYASSRVFRLSSGIS